VFLPITAARRSILALLIVILLLGAANSQEVQIATHGIGSAGRVFEMFHYVAFFYPYALVCIVSGVCLAIAGFRDALAQLWSR
jgi:hypothetical protein